MSISVSVDTTKLNEIIAKLPGNRDKIARECAVHALFISKQTTAYKDVTGELRGSNDVVPLGDGVWNIEYYAEYAPYVELGTHNEDESIRMPARPFLKPAVEAEAKLLENRIKEGLIEK